MGDWRVTARNRYMSEASPSFDSDHSTVTAGSSSSGVFQDTQKLQARPDTDHLRMMGLGLSSPSLDWNQALLREEKGESGFRPMLQENLNLNPNNYHQDEQVQWRGKLFGVSGSESSVNQYKQINRGFSLDHDENTSTCQGLPSSTFHMDSPAIFQGLLGSDLKYQPQRPSESSFESRSVGYPHPGDFMMDSSEQMSSNRSRSVPQFLRTLPPKQPQPNTHPFQFSDNSLSWNASAATMNDVRPNFISSFTAPSFEQKPKNISDVRESGVLMKKTSSEIASKRPRSNETPSPVPPFKVRKEKMGDRITALQQLVSPFGKTDTASVLSEAIEYIKFLHEQVNFLTAPYMKSGTHLQHQHQQNCDKSKDLEGSKQDLRSRGLCLVPVSGTFPVTHETTVDICTPTFGGTFR